MKKTIKMKKILKESQEATIKDIEKSYGKDVAAALIKYCGEKDKDIDKVINDLTPDKFGLTEWDWFEKWAKRTLKLDIYGGFSDDWKDELDRDAEGNDDEEDVKEKVKSANKRARRGREVKIYSVPSRYDYMKESNGRIDQQYVIDWIGMELGECEWCSDFTFDDYDPIIEIETTDGDKFEISVKKLGGQVKNNKVEKIKKILTDDELSADAMVSEIGEIVDEYESDPILKKISNVLNDEDLSAEAMVSEIGELV